MSVVVLKDGNTQHEVKDGDCYLECTCDIFRHKYESFYHGRNKFAPVCKHIRRCYVEKLDHIPTHSSPVNIILAGGPTLQGDINVAITWDGDTGEVNILYPTYPQFVGFVSQNACRSDIREMLYPLMIERYFGAKCSGCQERPDNIHRAELAGSNTRQLAVCRASYMIKTNGYCQYCDMSDLVPDASPDPVGAKSKTHTTAASKMTYAPATVTIGPNSTTVWTSNHTTWTTKPGDDLPF